MSEPFNPNEINLLGTPKPNLAAPSGGFFKKVAAMMASKIGMGIMTSLIASTILSSGMLWGGFRAFCAVLGKIGDQEVARKIDMVIGKGEQVAKADPGAPKPSFKEKIENKVTGPVKGAVNEAKEGAKEIGDKVGKTADTVADKFNGIGGTPEERQERAEHAERVERDKLIGRATILEVKYEDSWPTDKLRSEVVKAEAQKEKEQIALKQAAYEEKQRLVREEKEKQEAYIEWNAKYGKNGMCPACHYPMKVSLRGNGRVACPNARCGLNSSASQVRGQGAPPPPRFPPPAFHAYWKERQAAKKRQGEAESAEKDNSPAKDGGSDEGERKTTPAASEQGTR